MRILVVASGEFTGDSLEVGKYYDCEPAEEGSENQNRLFHALLTTYFISGCFSYPAKNVEELKNYIKRYLGLGYESYVYVEQRENGLFRGEVKNLEDIPPNVALDGNGKKMVWGRLKSWSKYGKKSRMETISGLIAEMHQAGVQTKKFFQILDGIEKLDIWGSKKTTGALAAEAAE
jgi:hypothetical protein